MRSTLVASLILVASFLTSVRADSFGAGANAFDIEFVTIGDPGNPADTTGDPNPAGSVAYSYRIGKYEISEQMIDKANSLGGLGLTKDTRGPNKPATSLTWFEAAKFVNWLNAITGNTPAYKFDNSGNFQLWEPGDAGYDTSNLYRNSLAKYFLPSVDEWYKAAYYDPIAGVYFDYPTGSDNEPASVLSGVAADTAVYSIGREPPANITQAGGLSPYNTMAQGGNVYEWQETESDTVNDSVSSSRVWRGGASASNGVYLTSGRRDTLLPAGYSSGLGFRVASTIPEPGTALLAGLATLGLLVSRRRRRI